MVLDVKILQNSEQNYKEGEKRGEYKLYHQGKQSRELPMDLEIPDTNWFYVEYWKNSLFKTFVKCFLKNISY